MKITDLLTLSTIELNAKAKNKNDVLNQAVALMSKSGVITNVEKYKEGVFAREKISSTGVGEGIAIPHCKSNVVTKPHLAAMVIRDGVEYDSLDGEPIQLLFLIAAPDTKDNVHLDVLARLSTLLMHEDFKSSLLAAKNENEFLKAIDAAEEKAIEKEKPVEQTTNNEREWPKIVCVTACATGIAHTYMAQEALDKAAKDMNIHVKIETQGAVPKNILTQEEIDHAQAVIVAADIAVPMERFNGKPLICVGTAKAIKDSKTLVEKALSGKISAYKALGATKDKKAPKSNKNSFDDLKASKWQTFYRHLLSGLSNMIPFVVAGGILLSISYIIDSACGVNYSSPTGFGTTTIAAFWFNFLGNFILLYLMVPVLAGFTARSIGGKPAGVAGFGAGLAAILVITMWSKINPANSAGLKVSFNIMWFIDVGTHGGIRQIVNEGKLPEFAQLAVDAMPGFLGGLAGGFGAGYLTLGITKGLSKMPKSLSGLRDILLIPLLSSFGIAATMFVMNAPFSCLTYGIKLGLTGLGDHGLLWLLCIILAMMTSIDMGGPINKAQHLFAVGLISDAISSGKIMEPEGIFAQQCLAATVAACMVPPMSLAVACWLFPQKFEEEERKPAVANLITGFCGITEGAIPYVAKRPIIWVATISGAGVAGFMSWVFKGVVIAPEGGYIGLFTMSKDCWRAILGSLCGVAWSTIILGLILKDVSPDKAKLGTWRGIPFGFKDAAGRIHVLNVKLANKKPEFNQIAYDDYSKRMELIKSALDQKVKDKKERIAENKLKLTHKKLEPDAIQAKEKHYDAQLVKFQEKINKTKASIDEKVLAKKAELELAAKERKAKFNKAEFDAYEKEILAKIEKIQKNEALKQQKKAEKAAAKLAKQKAKEQTSLAA